MTKSPRPPASSAGVGPPAAPPPAAPPSARSWERFIGFFVRHKVVVWLLTASLVGGGLYVVPFEAAGLRALGIDLPRDPVPVDALPDLSDNQQIVFTPWPGRSPRDVEDQVTYPLTTALLGLRGVRSVRASSMFGFSSIYVVFEDGVDFYGSRSRVLEKLASLPAGTLPADAAPALGPDATALGQVFWYTLDGLNREGELVGGWDLHELRSIQDFTIRYALQAVPGVAEVASVGGYVREYQVDVDPNAMRARGVRLDQVASAIAASNRDVGARTLEINRVEYIVRGLGLIATVDDLEASVIIARDGVPIRVGDVARVTLGPAERRGALDDAGAPAVGGVVVTRFGENPMQVLERVSAKIATIAPGLPKRTLADGTVSQVAIVPFYDRTTLIRETLATLSGALLQQVLITLLVVLVMLRIFTGGPPRAPGSPGHPAPALRSALLIAAVMPLSVLAAFVAMKWTGVSAHIMALAGIAIAIGTMVDMGIVVTENIVARGHGVDNTGEASLMSVVRAVAEVAPAVLTSVLTTVVSFLPVFALTASEGKLFTPLALTKTFAMVAALIISLVVLPPLAHLCLRAGRRSRFRFSAWLRTLFGWTVVAALTVVLAQAWRPLGPGDLAGTELLNLALVAGCVGGLLGLFALFHAVYTPALRVALRHKALALALPLAVTGFGFTAWLGFDAAFGWLPAPVKTLRPFRHLAHALPGFGREFMPPFDEGAYLYMPTTMPHASLGQALEMLSEMDAAIEAIPEVERAVGKLGRAQSPLDPAPISMFETLVTYRPEYTSHQGRRFRQWRDHIRSPEDIWAEVVRAAQAPGLTSAPVLMPITARLTMLESGMRAPMGIKIAGPDLETIEAFGKKLEDLLKEVPQIRAETVFAERVVGKPYLQIDIDREAIGRHGLTVSAVQDVIQIALGGPRLTTTVEGRERYPVRVRYMREARDSVEALERIFVPAPGGAQVPLGQLAEVRYARGPQVIRTEDAFLTSYVLFDRAAGLAEVDVVEAAKARVEAAIAQGRLEVPSGVSYRFAGRYENQLRSEKRLLILIPLALMLVFLILYLQFRRSATALIVFSGVLISMGGGFILLWLGGQAWFGELGLFGVSLRALFGFKTVHLSVAVWVGFIALVGIATDVGVVLATHLAQRFQQDPPRTAEAIRARALEAGQRRVRPCLMTAATTVLALLPILTASGRGADVMAPMALPLAGGMGALLLTLFTVPVLYAWMEERRLVRTNGARNRVNDSGRRASG